MQTEAQCCRERERERASREYGIERGLGELVAGSGDGMEWKGRLLSEEAWDLGFGIWGLGFGEGGGFGVVSGGSEHLARSRSEVRFVLLWWMEGGAFGWGVAVPVPVLVPVPVPVGGSSHRLCWGRGDAG